MGCDVDFFGSGNVCRWGWPWAVRGVRVVGALDPVFFYSERIRSTCCWEGGLSWGQSDVDVNNVFDVMDIAFVPFFDLITPVVVVKGSVFVMRLCKGASA